MKKILIITCAMFVAGSANAQSNDQVQNKNGVDIMPVSGEFAVGVGVGFDALFTWTGDLFGLTGSNTSMNNTWVNNPLFGGTTVSIWGKYMVSDNNALRMSIANSGNDNTFLYETFDDRSNDPDSIVIDKERFNSSQTYVSAGWEFRRGKTRLRGIYGGDAMLSWENSHEHYTYGNQLGATNLTPTTNVGFWDNNFGRATQIRNGATFGIGVRAFVGVEYFVAPKICIGTEFGWSALYEISGASDTHFERYDPFADGGNGAIVKHTETTLGSRSWSSGIDNFNTQLYFNFYF